MTRVFVVDTSYLTEFYSVPRFSEPRFSKVLIGRMVQEVSGRFHVPVGCLKAYEPDPEPDPLV